MENLQKPMVSIICLTYNHEKYLRKTLDGFFQQKIDFSIEILIHDDASTDRTQDIIREYANKYPTVVKSILQKENQFQKRVPIIQEILFPMVQGKYIAMCEGDDYWSDNNKLQMQCDALETHVSCCACVHQVQMMTEDGKDTTRIMPDNEIQEGVMKGASVAKFAIQSLPFQTSSYFFKTEALEEYLNAPPAFCRESTEYGDLTLLLYLSQKGEIYYLKRKMSCYRMNSISSVTKQWATDKQRRHRRIERDAVVMLLFDEYSNGENRDAVLNRAERDIQNLRFDEAIKRRDYKTAYWKCKSYLRTRSWHYRVGCFALSIFPCLDVFTKYIFKIKDKLKGRLNR